LFVVDELASVISITGSCEAGYNGAASLSAEAADRDNDLAL
jgi:hypothetical protein